MRQKKKKHNISALLIKYADLWVLLDVAVVIALGPW